MVVCFLFKRFAWPGEWNELTRFFPGVVGFRVFGVTSTRSPRVEFGCRLQLGVLLAGFCGISWSGSFLGALGLCGWSSFLWALRLRGVTTASPLTKRVSAEAEIACVVPLVEGPQPQTNTCPFQFFLFLLCA